MHNNIVALIFLYSLNRLQELDRLCENIENFDISLVIGIDHINNIEIQKFLHKYRNRIIYYNSHTNYGVDIAPFLQQINLIDSTKYPYFIKLHSKQSRLGKKKQVDWGSILWDSLIGNTIIFNHNLKIIQQHYVGAISQPKFIYNNKEFSNKQKINTLCQYLNINYELVQNTSFMAGSIFMGKTQVFKNIFSDDKIKYLDLLLSTETGKIDDFNSINGTFAHSLERIFGYLVTAQKLCIHKSSMYPIIKIHNKKRKTLHLHITYNNICYLVEDFNTCGKIIENNLKFLTIEWYHLNNQLVKYKYLHDKHITQA